jgi:hypothetical protein
MALQRTVQLLNIEQRFKKKNLSECECDDDDE